MIARGLNVHKTIVLNEHLQSYKYAYPIVMWYCYCIKLDIETMCYSKAFLKKLRKLKAKINAIKTFLYFIGRSHADVLSLVHFRGSQEY